VVDVSLLEHALREDLNARSPRVMAVLRPLKLVIENFPASDTIEFDALYDPEKPDGASRKVPLTKELYIEREDFSETPAKKWFRLAPGQEVRLRYACLVTCREVKKDAAGHVTEVVCTWDPKSGGGNAPDGRKVKGTLHWVSAKHALPAEVRLYDRLFSAENPLKDKDVEYTKFLNPASLETLPGAFVEPSLKDVKALDRFQFERVGYFCVDPDSTANKRVFNRTISLKDSWAGGAGGGKE
jgi:glutaminyl-tRNA synthetase